MNEKMVRVNFDVPEQTRRRLKMVAARDGVDMSALMREAVDQVLAKHEPEAQPKARK